MTYLANVQMLVEKTYDLVLMKILILPGIKLETGRKALYCGANMWNSLPSSIRNVNTLYVFKYKLKNFLLDTCS